MSKQKMSLKAAIDFAGAYIGRRKEVRQVLLAEARRLNPKVVDNETRKLHNFPSDLGEERLLLLIDKANEIDNSEPAPSAKAEDGQSGQPRRLARFLRGGA